MPNKPIGYPVTATKMWLLSLASLGFWTTYWIFRNFQSFRRKEITGIHYCPETYTALFCLSYYNLLEFIEMTGRSKGVLIKLAKKRLAFAMFLLVLPAFALSLLRQDSVYHIVVMLFLPLALEPARRAICTLNKELGMDVSVKFGPFEKMVFVCGVAYWAACAYVDFG